MCGVIIRTAVSQGYHRDPSLSPGISVLQAEYRRRAWSAVVSIDDMASFIGGFPRMMSSLHADTAEPRNLHEWEMVEGMEALPPSRPLAEKTPTTYLIVKGRLCRALGRVTDFNGTPGLGPYETVLEIDRALQDSYDNFPPHMIPASDTAGRVSIRNRADFSNLALLCMYHRGMCVLHRRFLARDRAGGRFRLSRDRCVASALALLGFQQDLEASLHGVAAIRQLLTLAAMVLVLELEVRRKVPDAEAAPDADVLLRALEESVVRWSLAADTYDDARKVHEFLGRIVSGFRTGQTGGGAGTTSTGEPGPPTWQEDPGTGLSAPVFSFEEDLATMDFDWVSRALSNPRLQNLPATNNPRPHGMRSSRLVAKRFLPPESPHVWELSPFAARQYQISGFPLSYSLGVWAGLCGVLGPVFFADLGYLKTPPASGNLSPRVARRGSSTHAPHLRRARPTQ